ncbi:hypothetical protein L484_010757 [Morus notabilis]|uniref:Uncharacterized protein n=1 Tax=Morus notabilis TaxID=981085 RepID=W9SVN9_9ROSA|nr:hypothetical protein L484_010757 [Morus notabilis]
MKPSETRFKSPTQWKHTEKVKWNPDRSGSGSNDVIPTKETISAGGSRPLDGEEFGYPAMVCSAAGFKVSYGTSYQFWECYLIGIGGKRFEFRVSRLCRRRSVDFPRKT